ncbi:MAG: hypothetical protein AAGE84_13495 [Cyanobacteria bacterium P01_G01_bin.39]
MELLNTAATTFESRGEGLTPYLKFIYPGYFQSMSRNKEKFAENKINN